MDKSKFITNLSTNTELVSQGGVYFSVESNKGEDPIILGLGNLVQAQKYLTTNYPGVVIPV